jgi:hypothetical protein
MLEATQNVNRIVVAGRSEDPAEDGAESYGLRVTGYSLLFEQPYAKDNCSDI